MKTPKTTTADRRLAPVPCSVTLAMGCTSEKIAKQHNNAEHVSSTDWLDVLAKIVRCFGDMEGTWYQGDWKSYGVTPEQETMIEAAVARQESTSNA